MDSEGHAERRNLSALSFAIIVFFLAGGSIDLQIVRLGIFNASFQRGYVLEIAIWVALFWFALRFWLITKGQFTKEMLVNQLSRVRNGKLVHAYISRRFNGLECIKPGKVFSSDEISKLFVVVRNIRINTSAARRSNNLLIECEVTKLAALSNGGEQTRFESVPNNNIRAVKGFAGNQLQIKGFTGRLLLATIAITNIHREPGFSQMIIPFILFAFAVICGLWNLASNSSFLV